MNLIEFSKMIKDPSNVTGKQADALENIINEFPYFQAAHALYLHALKDRNSFRFNTVLKRTAAHTTDRSILFDFITEDKIVVENYISKDAKEKETPIKPAENVLNQEHTDSPEIKPGADPPKEDDNPPPFGLSSGWPQRQRS